MSMHWLRIQIHWLHEDWGVEQLYYCRDTYGTRKWTSQEDELIHAHYPTLPRLELLELLRERSWEAIRHRGLQLHVTRPLAWEKIGNQKMTWDDLKFMEQEGIEEGLKLTKWVALSQPAKSASGR